MTLNDLWSFWIAIENSDIFKGSILKYLTIAFTICSAERSFSQLENLMDEKKTNSNIETIRAKMLGTYNYDIILNK